SVCWLYRVDYVYFENSSSNPLLIRRIEELNKTANGNVEAKVVCFYRRRDISSTLIALADKHARELEEEMENPELNPVDLPEKQKHQLRHRELFLSRQLESLPATHIRGKCCVTLLNETEALKSYLDREDAFFYSLVYDPQQKTLLADKGEIRVGNKYQADITDFLKEGEEDGRDLAELEERVWDPSSPLTEKQIDQFLVVARSVGTFARALDCSSSVRQPSLHMSAAAASRDITLFHAMDSLDKTRYDMTRAIAALVPQGGPVLCRDEMEEWSASEANLFEEALEKYGKDFTDIQQDFVSLVNGQTPGLGRACESCYTTSSYQWYSWGPPNMQCRLCASCWTYWKKYGGLKMPTRLEGERPGPNRNNMSPHSVPMRHGGSPKFAVKTKQAFYLQTTQVTRAARRVCQDIIRPRFLARHPYLPLNTAQIKQECVLRLPDEPKKPLPLKPVERKPLESVVRYLEAHPCPPKHDPPRGQTVTTGSLTPIKSTPNILNNGSPTILGKRTYEQHNGIDGERPRCGRGVERGWSPWDVDGKPLCGHLSFFFFFFFCSLPFSTPPPHLPLSQCNWLYMPLFFRSPTFRLSLSLSPLTVYYFCTICLRRSLLYPLFFSCTVLFFLFVLLSPCLSLCLCTSISVGCSEGWFLSLWCISL
uniref:Metastasis associated 1 n=1 Tax=Oncorhynchus mykiss TaxID=8022 RepID=A0A8C7SK06_ONCMY